MEPPVTYYDLLAAAQHQPDDADYHALRMAYARSGDYAPYEHDQEHLEALRGALHADDLQAALAAIQGLLDHNYLDIEAHMSADFVHTRLDSPARSAYHRAFAKGLIDAIMATGSGRDFATAFIVLSVQEEYLVLRLMGFKPAGQRLVEHEGHWFDVMAARHPSREEPFDVYFNIDLPRTWLHHHVAGETDDPPG